ncbi:hypothetical protein Hanom_Chr11g01008811 [Helianthus anomalus]
MVVLVTPSQADGCLGHAISSGWLSWSRHLKRMVILVTPSLVVDKVIPPSSGGFPSYYRYLISPLPQLRRVTPGYNHVRPWPISSGLPYFRHL